MPSRAGLVVKWDGRDDDVPAGHAGSVVCQRDDGRTRVQFPNGTWNFKNGELTSMGYSIGNAVTWDRSDSDIPRGTVGRVLGATEVGDVRAEFLGRSFRFNAEDLTKSEEDEVQGRVSASRCESVLSLPRTVCVLSLCRGKVAGASASSFEVLEDGYAKDSSDVFYKGKMVAGASASSFVVLGGGWGSYLSKLLHSYLVR